ncbi:astrotactin-2 isoform X2 [Rana temporaria]|uniref:astrotactin-2 isoform X2 n=1 Tax=Rana temporaria TaxID=8407 RepID=UPI001AACD160|nr:astrotactin-2 isoform X2 [Rana temporaria]
MPGMPVEERAAHRLSLYRPLRSQSVRPSGAMLGLLRLLSLLIPVSMAGSSSAPAGCLVKTVTVSTLPALRERELSWSGAVSSLHPGDSRLPLHIHSEAPGSVSVRDDLHNTEPPYFTLEMSGTGDDLSLVYWTQKWLENGTLYFHVSLNMREHTSISTSPTMAEPVQELDEQLHVLHVSVMGGLIALLLLLLIFSFALFAQRRWHKRRRIPQKSASTEATHEIHYIPSVLLGPPSRDFRSSKLQPHSSVLRMSIRETPILDDYDCDEEDTPRCTERRPKMDCKKQATQEREDKRHLQKRGALKSPLSRTALTLVGVSACVLAVVCGSQISCPLTVKVTLHVPEHFIADGSSFVITEGSYLDISNWVNPAKLFLYYQVNATSPWVRDLCGQRTIDSCEQICDPETGECSCHEGYAPDPNHPHLCIRSDWGQSQGPWPYNTLEKGYDLVTGQQAPEKTLRSTYSLGQGVWLPVSKSFVVPPMELSISPLASCKTDVLVTEDPGDVRQEALLATHFETVDDLLSSFGPVRDCSFSNGGCSRNFKCVSERKVDTTGCVCPAGLKPMKDGSGCYEYSKGIDCSDGTNGGCEQLCLQQMISLPNNPSESAIYMFCGCVEEYRLAIDGRSCILVSDMCEGARCLRPESHLNNTLFGEMLHGFDNKTQRVNQGQVFQMSFRENNFIKDFPQLADGLLVIPLPVEEQCRGVLSEPRPDILLLTGEVRYNEAMGYPVVQQWRVQSNLYKVKLNSISLSAGFANVLKVISSHSSREELQSILQTYGTHYISEALYGSELTCTIRFPSKKVQQQLWLQYQKETTELGSKKELKSMPFITYLSGLLTAQMLSDDQLILGVEIHCEEKGRCPASCHLCRRAGKEQISPIPVLLEINRITPLYNLIQDNSTREVFKNAFMSLYWCTGKGEVIDDWCRCDLTAFDENGLPNCSPLPPPVFRLSPSMEPSSNVVALEWLDVQATIGTKVSDYILHHKKVDEYTDTELYTGESLSLTDDLLSGLGTACISAGRSHGGSTDKNLYSVIFKCLEADSLYKFSLIAVDTHGRHSAQSLVTLRTACSLVDDSKAEEIADRIYTLYNGYTSGKEQQIAYNTLMEVSASMLLRVQHHYNTLYEKFGDFVWRSEDELGPRKAHLVLRRLEKVSSHCSGLLRSTHIQRRIDNIPYLICHSEDLRTSGFVLYSILKDSKFTCEEKMVSMPRNTYGDSKGR